VREIASLGGEVNKFVSGVVNERLIEKVRVRAQEQSD
jgi:phosphopantetheine adenylyltransferase